MLLWTLSVQIQGAVCSFRFRSVHQVLLTNKTPRIRWCIATAEMIHDTWFMNGYLVHCPLFQLTNLCEMQHFDVTFLRWSVLKKSFGCIAVIIAVFIIFSLRTTTFPVFRIEHHVSILASYPGCPEGVARFYCERISSLVCTNRVELQHKVIMFRIVHNSHSLHLL